MYSRTVLIAFAAMILAACAPTQAKPAKVALRSLAAQETEFLCSVVPEHASKMGSDHYEGSGEAYDRRMEEVMASIKWQNGWHWPRCADGKPLSFWSHYYLDGFGISSDGRAGAIAGGWQAAPLAGAAGQCYFERRDLTWVLLGCVVTSVS